MFETVEDERTERTNQRSYNFTPVEKERFGPGANPLSKIIRITKKQISVAEDVAKRFKGHVQDNGYTKYYLAIRVDDVNQAIQIGEPREGESVFIFSTGSAATNSKNIHVNMPKRMSTMALPAGDYVEVEHGVFVLAK